MQLHPCSGVPLQLCHSSKRCPVNILQNNTACTAVALMACSSNLCSTSLCQLPFTPCMGSMTWLSRSNQPLCAALTGEDPSQYLSSQPWPCYVARCLLTACNHWPQRLQSCWCLTNFIRSNPLIAAAVGASSLGQGHAAWLALHSVSVR
jgi:hypothetical protein